MQRLRCPLVLEKITQEKYPRMELVWADCKYDNRKLDAWLQCNRPTWRLEIKKPPKQPDDAPKTFVPIAKRWVVERTFAWMGRNRRINEDDERTDSSSEATVWPANISLRLGRLAPKKPQKFNDRA